MVHDETCIPDDAYNACTNHLRGNFPQLVECEMIDCENRGAVLTLNPFAEMPEGPRTMVLCRTHAYTTV